MRSIDHAKEKYMYPSIVDLALSMLKQAKDSLVRNWKYIHYVIIIFLLVSLAWGFLGYWSHRQTAGQTLETKSEEIREQGFFLVEQSIPDTNVGNINRILNFTDFLNYARQQNTSEIWLDTSQRILYFPRPSLDNGLIIIGFYYAHSDWDWGGVWSLLLTTFVVWWAKGPRWIISKLSTQEPLRCVVALIIVLVGLSGIWLSIRITLLYFMRYILEEGFIYTPTDIFEIIGFIATANLSLTLFRALTLGQKKGDRKETREDSKNIIRGLIEVAIQAVIIGLLTFIPGYNQSEFLNRVNGYVGYVAILIAMVVAMLVLVLSRHYLISEKEKRLLQK